jgi:serine/threonine protein kinase
MDKVANIVLELGECSLRSWIDASREITQGELISVLCDVCEGLKSIHDKKMIHRDIKPENIIKKDNIYKITDFGVSCEK